MKSYKSAALYSDKPNKWGYQVVKKYLSLHTQNIPFGCVYKLRILVLIWVFRTIWYLVTGHESIWGWPKLNIYPQNWMVHSEIRWETVELRRNVNGQLQRTLSKTQEILIEAKWHRHGSVRLRFQNSTARFWGLTDRYAALDMPQIEAQHTYSIRFDLGIEKEMNWNPHRGEVFNSGETK